MSLRNLSHGPASSHIEDLQVGVVKNLQGDGHAASVVKTSTCRGDGGEKNRNSINFERQQAQVEARQVGQTKLVNCGRSLRLPVRQTRLSTLDCSMPTSSTTLMPAPFLCAVSESYSGRSDSR